MMCCEYICSCYIYNSRKFPHAIYGNAHFWLIKNYELCASDHHPSPRHPPLVPCAGDEGTPSPHHECLYQYHEKNNSVKNAKCLSQDKHVTLWRRVAAAITTDDATNLHTIKNAIVFISEHILVQFGVSK